MADLTDYLKTSFQVAVSQVQASAKEKKTGHNKLSSEQIQSVKEHIALFPRYDSHYTRNHQATKQYLAQHLNIKIIYKRYVDSCNDKDLSQ